MKGRTAYGSATCLALQAVQRQGQCQLTGKRPCLRPAHLLHEAKCLHA